MALHPQTQKLVDQFYASRPKPIWEMDIHEYRRIREQNAKLLAGNPVPVWHVEDKNIPVLSGNIDIRIYTPHNLKSDGVILYFPGSGFVDGNLASQDNTCRQIANCSECKVVQVSYRAAPEFIYPIGLNDAFAAIEWIHDHALALGINRNKVAIMGYSSGANFAALCAIRARNEHRPIRCVVLNAPVTDLACDFASYEEFSSGYILESKALDYFLQVYLPKNTDRKDAHVSPFYEKNLFDLPPTLIQTSEFDPLADDGKKYAEKLKAAGNDVKYTCYKGQIHALLAWSGGVLNEGENPCEEVGRYIKQYF
ncbi:MAG: hypothetical protein A2103_01840 [Gammaproteobacteria bacterium GWF2_41_13]|nr:MAG: hypothetical protein A2103_01840 [Gammaproteobacteria bacterium GWF2_41_13]